MYTLRRLLEPEYREFINRLYALMTTFVLGVSGHWGIVVFTNWLEWPPVVEGLIAVAFFVGVVGIGLVCVRALANADPAPSEHEQMLILLREIADRRPERDH